MICIPDDIIVEYLFQIRSQRGSLNEKETSSVRTGICLLNVSQNQ